MPLVLLIPAAKCATDVIITYGKFATSVVDTGDHLHLQISQIFEKIRNDPNVIFRGLGEDDYEKNLKQKIS